MAERIFPGLRRVERKLPAPEMGFIGDPRVLESLVRTDNPEERLVILWGPGGQKSAIQVGEAEALRDNKLDKKPVAHVSVSAGGGAAFALLNQCTEEWRDIFPRRNPKNKLFSARRGIRHMLDIDGLEKVFRALTPNYDALRQHPATLYTAISDARTAAGTMLNLNKFDDPILGLIASMNIPGINGGKKVIINGREAIDGGFAYPLPISWIVRNLNPTAILAFLSEPFTNAQQSYVQGLIAEMFSKKYTGK